MKNLHLVEAVYRDTQPLHSETIGIYEDYDDAIKRRDHIRARPDLFPLYHGPGVDVDVFHRLLHERGEA